MRKINRETWILIFIASAIFIVHLISNSRYGFFRDELGTLSDSHHLDWGFVSYPPLTPFFGRLSLELFGISTRGIRFFPGIAMSICIIVGGWMARLLGGDRFAQILAGLAVAASPVLLASGALLEYVSFDFLFWVLAAYFVMRAIHDDDSKWFVGLGAAIGLGLMTKYSMLFFVGAILFGLIMTPARSLLKSRWFFVAVALAFVIFLPNFIWQIQHHFISLDFLRSIHARDIRIGRASHYISEQFLTNFCPITVPLVFAGLYFYFFDSEGKRYRTIGWMFVFMFLFFLVAKGRAYYLAPAYPMLLAAGAVVFERWTSSKSPSTRLALRRTAIIATAVGIVLVACVTFPLAPINSGWQRFAMANNGDLREEFGWQELTAEVARIYNSLPPAERATTAILGTNYGEAGAIELLGPAYGLPRPISGVNSFWLRGYPHPEPQAVIVIGLDQKWRDRYFQSCELAGNNGNPYGIKNEESEDHPDIFLCHGLRMTWPDFWAEFKYYG